jgi:uridine kinase
MELTLVGLQNSGKTTLVNVIAVRIPKHSTARFVQLHYYIDTHQMAGRNNSDG